MISDGYNEYMVDEDSDGNEAESSEDEIQQWLTGTPEQRRKIRRRSLGHESSSDDDFEKEMNKELNETLTRIEDKRKSNRKGETSASTSTGQSSTTANKDGNFYDEEYFDSDDEGNSKGQQPKLSNDDLLYDPDMDDEDQKWVDDQRRSHLPKSTQKKGKKPVNNSDGVLDCPACLTTLCLDCQRHDIYKEQYRAMFVMNCKVNFTERLKFPKQQNKTKKISKRKRKNNQETPMDTDNVVPDEDNEKLYHPVCCDECNTEVGVYDDEEIYHFFNVLVSY